MIEQTEASANRDPSRTAIEIFNDALACSDDNREQFLEEQCRGCATIEAEVGSLLEAHLDAQRTGFLALPSAGIDRGPSARQSAEGKPMAYESDSVAMQEPHDPRASIGPLPRSARDWSRRHWRRVCRVKSEIERAVCEEDPDKPSTAISRIHHLDSTDDTPTGLTEVTPESVSRARGGRPDRLRRRLVGDVDNIVLMAMRKEPGRRYASAEQLAEDIRRHLDGMPVIARHDTFGYRTAKFASRHKASIGSAAVMALLLVGGIITTMTQKATADEQRQSADDANERATRMSDQGRTVAKILMGDIYDEIKDLDGSLSAQELLVTTAHDYLDQLVGEVENDDELKLELADGYNRIGDIKGGMRESSYGDPQQALNLSRQALQLQQDVLASKPNDRDVLYAIASTRIRIGDALLQLGKSNDARAQYDRTVAICQGAMEDNDNQRARRAHSIALVARCKVYVRQGEDAKARELYEEVLSIRARLASENRGDLKAQRELALAHSRIADRHAATGDFEKALEHYLINLKIREMLVGANADSAQARRYLGLVLYHVSGTYLELGSPSQALEHAERCYLLATELFDDNPGDVKAEELLAYAQEALGRAYEALGDLEQARYYFDAFRETATTLAKQHPGQYDRRLARSEERLGDLAVWEANEPLAQEHYLVALSKTN